MSSHPIIAPVVAVHGNNEPEHVKQELPYQPLISIHDLIELATKIINEPFIEYRGMSGSYN